MHLRTHPTNTIRKAQVRKKILQFGGQYLRAPLHPHEFLDVLIQPPTATRDEQVLAAVRRILNGVAWYGTDDWASSNTASLNTS